MVIPGCERGVLSSCLLHGLSTPSTFLIN